MIHLSNQSERPSERLLEFIRTKRIGILNVAGPQGSMEPEIGNFVKSVLAALLQANCDDDHACPSSG